MQAEAEATEDDGTLTNAALVARAAARAIRVANASDPSSSGPCSLAAGAARWVAETGLLPVADPPVAAALARRHLPLPIALLGRAGERIPPGAVL